MLLKNEKRLNLLKDFLLLGIILYLVSISLPISTMGHQNAFDYFFSQKEVQILSTNSDCLVSGSSCSIPFGKNGLMTVTMPTRVSSTQAFNISVIFSDKKVDGVSVLFKGVEHSHGLRKQLMTESNPRTFTVSGQLGYCGSGIMQWSAIFDVHSDRTIYRISLPFSSIDPKADSIEALEWLNKTT